MPDVVHRPDTVERVRAAVAAEARRVPALADALAPLPSTACGELSDGGLRDAVERVRAALSADLAAAGDRLAALERAVEASGRSITGADGRAAASFGPRR